VYLFDTNIFLEILLSQEKASKCKKILSESIHQTTISDFTLHSIGVILFRKNKSDIFNRFTSDVLSKVDVISLSKESYVKLSHIKGQYSLDFDDAYQYLVAEENGLIIVTMDKHFESVADRITVNLL